MPTKQTQTDWVKTAARMPRDLHRDVHAAARQQNRTFNGQIVDTLRKHTPAAPTQPEAKQ